jgi:phosphoribosylanthranilate isomerase
VTDPGDALAAAEAGADAVGMLFAPSRRRISIEQGREIARALPRYVEKVGLFSDASAATIEEVADAVGLTAVQLHGDESPGFVTGLFRGTGRGSRIRVVKTIHVSGAEPADVGPYLRGDIADAFLLDTAVMDLTTGLVSRGGTGRTFDWARSAPLVEQLAARARVVVAGGLSPGNVGEAVRTLRPWGVDVCSGVERELGRKDLEKLREFVVAARAASAGSAPGNREGGRSPGPARSPLSGGGHSA